MAISPHRLAGASTVMQTIHTMQGNAREGGHHYDETQ